MALEFTAKVNGSNISVRDVVANTKLSRRQLDTRVRKAIGHSIASEIQRVQIEQAKRLLEETNYLVPGVAELAGYRSVSYMIQVFRRELDNSPAK